VAQYQALQELTDRLRLLPAIRDPRMRQSLSMEPQEVTVLRHQDSPGRTCKLEVYKIRHTPQANLAGCGDIDISPPQS
jgi:hypothetical protein